MKPVDLKRTKQDKKDEEDKYSECSPVGEDDYSYGLQFSLTDKELEKMDMELSSFTVGDELVMYGTVKVVSASQNESENDKRSSVGLLVNTLGLDSTADDENRLKKRYPNS